MSNHLVSGLLGAIDPGRPFIETSDGGVLTYGDFTALAGRFAGALDKSGVVPGDRVAVQVEKSVAALALYLGCVRAGAIFLPLNTAYTRTELEYFIADAEPRLLVVDPARQAALADLATVPGAPRVETLGAAGRRIAGRSRGPLQRVLRGSSAGARRPRRHPLHFRHHGSLQGRDADARQPALERADAPRRLALHAGRRAAARAADLPYARPVRRDPHDHGRGRRDAVPAALRRQGRGGPAASGLDHDGRADPLRSPARRTGAGRGGARYPALHLGLGAAPARDARGLHATHRPRDPRTLRHDRDEHEHLELIRGAARARPRRDRRCPASPCG